MNSRHACVPGLELSLELSLELVKPNLSSHKPVTNKVSLFLKVTAQWRVHLRALLCKQVPKALQQLSDTFWSV